MASVDDWKQAGQLGFRKYVRADWLAGGVVLFVPLKQAVQVYTQVFEARRE